MDGNEGVESSLHETGFDEKENLNISSAIGSSEGHNQDNVISK